MAEGEPIYDDYQRLGRMLNSSIRVKERALKKRVQKEYDTTAPGIKIQRQLNGEPSDNEKDDKSEPVNVQFKFAERRRLAEASLHNPSTFTAQKGFRRHINLSVDMIALCKRRERRPPRTYRSRGELSIKTADNLIILIKLKPEEKRSDLLKYKDF